MLPLIRMTSRTDSRGIVSTQNDGSDIPADDTVNVVPEQLQRGAFAEAEASCRAILASRPAHHEALHMLGLAVAQQGRLEEAVGHIQAAIALRRDVPALHSNLGNVQKLLGRQEAALASFDTALALAPDYAEAHSNRGNVLRELGRDDEALADYDAAIALAPHFADAHYNRGVVLQGMDRPLDALESYQAAINRAPAYAQAHNNRGLALQTLGRHDEALAAFAAASRLRPDYAEAHLHEGFCRLAAGDFRRGWPKYEYRRRLPGFPGRADRPPHLLWPGAALRAGTTVLLWAEQGLGDTLQFCRYAAVAADRGARVVLEVQPALKSLLRNTPGIDSIHAQGEPAPDFDFHSPLLSLPLLAGTDFSNMPAAVPYVHADPQRIQKFSARLGEKRRPRIGVVWSGNPSPYDRNDHRRSIPFEQFARLLHPAVQWVSLQKETREQDRRLSVNSGVIDVQDDIRDFADTAALAGLMDRVISIDTAVAHLAGAMAKPLWVLLPQQADWRWFRERQDSPWYPTATLFRQAQPGDWSDVLARVAVALQAWLQAPDSSAMTD